MDISVSSWCCTSLCSPKKKLIYTVRLVRLCVTKQVCQLLNDAITTLSEEAEDGHAQSSVKNCRIFIFYFTALCRQSQRT